MHEIKNKLMQELYEVEEKMKRAAGGKISAGDLEYIHKLTDTIKNIDKIEMLEDGDYSEASEWMADGRMYGNSYDDGMSYARGGRGRGRNARRDSMGRYSREGGGSYRGGSSYDDGMSYARGGRGGYSRDSAKEHMIGRIEDMMEETDDPKTKRALERCVQAIENA